MCMCGLKTWKSYEISTCIYSETLSKLDSLFTEKNPSISNNMSGPEGFLFRGV